MQDNIHKWSKDDYQYIFYHSQYKHPKIIIFMKTYLYNKNEIYMHDYYDILRTFANKYTTCDKYINSIHIYKYKSIFVDLLKHTIAHKPKSKSDMQYFIEKYIIAPNPDITITKYITSDIFEKKYMTSDILCYDYGDIDSDTLRYITSIDMKNYDADIIDMNDYCYDFHTRMNDYCYDFRNSVCRNAKVCNIMLQHIYEHPPSRVYSTKVCNIIHEHHDIILSALHDSIYCIKMI
jgi:hypothetical protein